LLDKDLEKFSDRQFHMDYAEWQREFLNYPNAVDYRDIKANQKNFIFFCSDFRLRDLIDIKPDEGAAYIRSLTEPFDLEILVDRFMNEMRHVIGENRWIRLNFVGLVEELFGETAGKDVDRITENWG